MWDEKTDELRAKLKELIKNNSFNYSPDARYKLACGAQSQFYFDCKRTTFRSDGQFYIGNIIYDMIDGMGFKAIGGLELGAIPIATSVAYVSHFLDDAIHAMIVRKGIKDHGTQRKIEGMVYPPKKTKVVVVDDVITTGGSTIEAIEAFKEAGYSVEMAIVLVDREEMDGRANVLKYVPDVRSIFTAKEFLMP